MMTWREIWAAKGSVQKRSLKLQDLIALDGFDGANSIPEDVWKKMVWNLERDLNLDNKNRVCDVCCGSGAFLLPLYEKGYRRLAGVDFSPGLVQICRKVMPGCDFRVCDANRIPFDAEAFDAVVCNSAFQYFPDLSYAEEVARKMFRVLRQGGGGAVLDVYDARLKERYEEMRRRALGDEEYDRLYGNNPHTSYERSWFVALAEKYDLEYATSGQSVPGYINSEFRFNFYFRKRQK